MMIVCYLAEDRETGRVVEDRFLVGKRYISTNSSRPTLSPLNWSKTGRSALAEIDAREVCKSWDLKLIDFDGPFRPFSFKLGLARPKWADVRPTGISSERWANRFMSVGELEAFRTGRECR